MIDNAFTHHAVLLKETVEGVITNVDGFYIDGTFGRGGHTRELLNRLGEGARVLAFDKDPEAIKIGKQLESEDDRFEIYHGSFAELESVITDKGMDGKVDGILLDLGVSSPQLDDAERGFSFMREGPLDMRMNNASGMTAADWLASAGEDEITTVLKTYGEEKFGRRIARAIIETRVENPLETTLELAELIDKARPVKEKHKHPATRSFQGIRIYLNKELDDLTTCLTDGLEVLAVGGHFSVISFHSLEDRIVKRFVQKHVKGDDFPPGLPVLESQMNKRLKSLGKAKKATADELKVNVRARSAVLRIAEKIA
ncbi:16S rRNA (cytosine(1402)-N(4))-methyltransferase [Gammaproteobacteria bacterium 45_16_T64]|nr:16S rRNA (cytosine(1402)-N(4))-methyltransferase [Gammaproteobacteria bacterium 45_16_T64]